MISIFIRVKNIKDFLPTNEYRLWKIYRSFCDERINDSFTSLFVLLNIFFKLICLFPRNKLSIDRIFNYLNRVRPLTYSRLVGYKAFSAQRILPLRDRTEWPKLFGFSKNNKNQCTSSNVKTYLKLFSLFLRCWFVKVDAMRLLLNYSFISHRLAVVVRYS